MLATARPIMSNQWVKQILYFKSMSPSYSEDKIHMGAFIIGLHFYRSVRKNVADFLFNTTWSSSMLRAVRKAFAAADVTWESLVLFPARKTIGDNVFSAPWPEATPSGRCLNLSSSGGEKLWHQVCPAHISPICLFPWPQLLWILSYCFRFLID